MNRIAVVTATLNWTRAEPTVWSWIKTLQAPIDLYLVMQGVQNADWQIVKHGALATVYGYHHREVLGVVPAYAIGVQQALDDGHPIIACFHDDLEIAERGWDETVWQAFKTHPAIGLAGFGGAKGLGEDAIYRKEYSPMDLVRKDFLSNMRDAEAHGRRVTEPTRVACLDGFSQIGSSDFWRGRAFAGMTRGGVRHLIDEPIKTASHTFAHVTNLFEILKIVGVVHHAYDAALGAFAYQLGYTTWMLPVKCHHHGGLTAVADPRYHAWADEFTWYNAVTGEEVRGDAGYWHQSHSIVYHMFRDVLPIRIP